MGPRADHRSIMQTTLDSTTDVTAGTKGIRPITVLLPVAPPQTYLRWLRWWRRSERRARALGASGDLVTRLALAPHPAELLWDVIGQEVSRQAGLAKRQGRASVMPRIRTTDLVLVRALGYMDRRHRFLECDYARRPTTRIAAPSPEFVALRTQVMRTATRQLQTPSRAARRRWAPSAAEKMQAMPRRRPRVRADAPIRSRARTHERHRPGQAA